MTKLKPLVTQWQGWMQLQRLLCNTNTYVTCVLDCTLAASATAYTADGEPNASKTFCPEKSVPCCPPSVKECHLYKVVPSHGCSLMTYLRCLVLPLTVCGTAGSNPALHISNPVKMGFLCFLWRHRTHQRFAITTWLWGPFTHIATMLWLLCFLPSLGLT